MKKAASILFVTAFFLVVVAFESVVLSNYKNVNVDDEIITFYVPEGWPEPAYDFTENPITQAKIDLGRALFYDQKLSRDSSMSCAGCHLSYTGFTHIDHSLSHGVEDSIGTRNTLAIMNPAWQSTFMWDGGINHLEKQPIAPLTSPVEMDNSLEGVLSYLQGSKKYQVMFEHAYGDSSLGIPNTMKALTVFMLQFNSYNSKYDQVMRGDEGVDFTERESKGYELYKNNCTSCHQEPLFTSEAYFSNGIGVDTSLNDVGRMLISRDSRDSLLFRVPTLRNIEVTKPYMHDGRFNNLQMVLHHYGQGNKDTLNLPSSLKELRLSESEKGEIITFLKTLTDVSFLRNKDLAYPR